MTEIRRLEDLLASLEPDSESYTRAQAECETLVDRALEIMQIGNGAIG